MFHDKTPLELVGIYGSTEQTQEVLAGMFAAEIHPPHAMRWLRRETFQRFLCSMRSNRSPRSTMERIEPSLESGINQASSHVHDDDSITAAIIITAASDADRDDVRDLLVAAIV